MGNVGHNGALCGARAEEAGAALAEGRRRRRCGARGRTALRLEAGPSDEPRGVLVGRLELVDDGLFTLLPLLALLIFETAELLGTQFPFLPLSLFLLLKVALVLFFALDIELNERRILCSVLSDASFSLGDIDVVDEVESWRQRWNGRASSQEIAY